MTIQIGDRLPDATFFVLGAGTIEGLSTDDVFKGKKVVLFAVPGAFTPTCDQSHLPGFLAEADRIKAKGIDTIAVTGVNDAFVMQAWAQASGANGRIEFLSDGNAEFARGIGLEMDASARGLGTRSKRYAMIVDDRIVKHLAVEDMPGKADVSGADAVISALDNAG